MKYDDIGFRGIYHNFFAVPIKDNLRTLIRDFPGADIANCILGYGYIDHEAGLTLEVLAPAIKDKAGFQFAGSRDSISAKIRIGSVIDGEFYFFEDNDGSLREKFRGF